MFDWLPVNSKQLVVLDYNYYNYDLLCDAHGLLFRMNLFGRGESLFSCYAVFVNLLLQINVFEKPH